MSARESESGARHIQLFMVLAFILTLVIIGVGVWQNWLLAQRSDAAPGAQTRAQTDLELVRQAAAATAPPAPILAKWVQLVPAGQAFHLDDMVIERPPAALVRAVLPRNTSCPSIGIGRPDGTRSQLTERQNPFAEGFPVTVCEATVQLSAEVDRVYFPDTSHLRIPRLEDLSEKDDKKRYHSFRGFLRVVFLGDTGCRGLKTKRSNLQACNQEGWPFGRIAAHAAATAENGDADPFVVVHVGDYVYRDRDTWELWQKDFFEPARPLLEAAPWIMLRGNHESCTFPEPNSSRGWFLFLDYADDGLPRQCAPGNNDAEFTDPYSLDLSENLRVAVFDSAETYVVSNPKNAEIKSTFQKQFRDDIWPKQVSNAQDMWLFTHIPPWGLAEDRDRDYGLSRETLQAAYHAGRADKRFTAVMSGDRHSFQLVQQQSAKAVVDQGEARSSTPATRENAQPVQFVIGNSGVKLDELPSPPSYRPGVDVAPQNVEAEVKKWQWTSVRSPGYVLACRGPKAPPPEGSTGLRPGRWTFMLWADDGDGELRLHSGLPAGEVRPDAPMPCVLDGGAPRCTPAAREGESDSEFVEHRCSWRGG